MRGVGAVGAPNVATSGGGALDPRDVQAAAVPLGEIRPRYPDALRARGADGAVLARYVVGEDGRVRDGSVAIVEATDSLLAASVRAALRTARFRPAEVGGRPVAQLVEQRFLFALRDR
jgi:protein TonB